MSAKEKILQREWTALHPYEKPVTSDSYYLNLANRILSAIEKTELENFTSDLRKSIALSVTAYFEDILSELGLWNTFVSKHHKMYGKHLPFYTLDGDYLAGDLNREDIAFIIWAEMQYSIISDGFPIDPFDELIEKLSNTIMEQLDHEYEIAPDNTHLKEILDDQDIYKNFFSFRNIASWLFYKSYLVAPSNRGLLEREIMSFPQSADISDEQRAVIFYSITNELIFTHACGPLALHVNEWLEGMVNANQAKELLKQVRVRKSKEKAYLVTSQDVFDIHVKPCDENIDLTVSKDSYNEKVSLQPGAEMIYTNLVYFNGRWQVNGMIVKDSREKFEELSAKVNLTAETFQNLYKTIMEESKNNSPLLYFQNKKAYLKYLSDKLGDSYDGSQLSDQEENNNILAFTHPDFGIAGILDLATAIKDKQNPYYNQQLAAKVAESFLMGKIDCPIQLIEYILKNKLLPDLAIETKQGTEKTGKQLAQKHIDFLFRFIQPQKF